MVPRINVTQIGVVIIINNKCFAYGASLFCECAGVNQHQMFAEGL